MGKEIRVRVVADPRILAPYHVYLFQIQPNIFQMLRGTGVPTDPVSSIGMLHGDAEGICRF